MQAQNNGFEARGKIYADLLETVGNTPLVSLARLKQNKKLVAEPLAKLEFFNPLSSVKDRIAKAMIDSAERAGHIRPGASTLIEPTSGNTGIGLAFIAAARGYRLILTMPESMSAERRKLFAYFGAEMALTPPSGGMRGAIDKATELLTQIPDSYCPGQFENPANPETHRRATAEEIWRDTAGEIDIFVAGVGTGGTLTGVADVLKQRNPDLQAIAVEPANSPVLSGGKPGPHGLQGIGAGFIPKTLDTSLIDETIAVKDEDALARSQEIAHLEGIPAGISSGAALQATIEVASRAENRDKRLVTILPSAAERYLSTALFAGLLESG
ncbi:cysteine synthase [Halorhodospira halochloris]|uniref:Cysteine synthase n=1 Tax=Halorhodospira halochloris TaxID=1052 RepID=A0A0X8X832_HALHR|nr:cysteine synthase A [Halorhodospira halochloris]MBK1651477.1 cysteine synthase A [Halorhodospira halochloris]BAU57260.1 cysteine synthase [Halorhodospira halochloris]